MTDKTYLYLWENAFENAINDIMNSISDEKKQAYSLSYKNDYERKKEDILYEYNIQRRNIREKFFDIGKDGKNLIDVHKICACFTAAILKVRVFEYTEKLPIALEIFYSNYTLAFLTGIHILYLSMLSDFSKLEDKRLFDMLKKQSTIMFPETNIGHDEYLQGRVKTLALNDMYEVDFDILTYADMLYWIEKYNKDLLLKKVSLNNQE